MIRFFIAICVFSSGCAHFNANLTRSKSHVIPLYFSTVAEGRHFYVIPCSVYLKTGHCILDTGMDTTQIADIPETSKFKTLYQVKSISMYGERIEDVVEVPELTLGDGFKKKNIPASRSNSFHNLPEYLGVIGSDAILGINLIFDFGKDTNAARVIIDPNEKELALFGFRQFEAMVNDKRFIAIQLVLEGFRIKAIWDTHAPVTAFSTQFIKAHPEFFKMIGSRKDKDAHAAEGVQNYYQLLKPVCIASQYCPYTTNYVVEHRFDLVGQGVENFDAILGNDFILSFNWRFDFKNQKYHVEPR